MAYINTNLMNTIKQLVSRNNFQGGKPPETLTEFINMLSEEMLRLSLLEEDATIGNLSPSTLLLKSYPAIQIALVARNGYPLSEYVNIVDVWVRYRDYLQDMDYAFKQFYPELKINKEFIRQFARQRG